MAGCERVQTPLVCNLTQAFWDREVVYIAQVTAQLDTWEPASASHKRFKPIRDSKWLCAVTRRHSGLNHIWHTFIEHYSRKQNVLKLPGVFVSEG